MPKLHELIIATGNPGKLKEFKELLSPLGIRMYAKHDFEHFPDPEETGATLEENALIKARAVYEAFGIPALADDTGLEVDALNGQPGVFSARYSGAHATSETNISKLLQELAGTAHRNAQFRTVLALYPMQEEAVFFSGVCKGTITFEKRGSSGFGYDPVFIPMGFEQTFAEMSAAQKNTISHRAQALSKFSDWLSDK